MTDVREIAARLREDPRISDVTIAGSYDAGSSASRLLVRTDHVHAREVAQLLEAHGGTLTCTGWETATVSGAWDGRLEALISLRQGISVLADLLVTLDAQGVSPLDELTRETTSLSDVPWKTLDDQPHERTGRWAVIALHEHDMAQLGFGTPYVNRSPVAGVLSVLISDIAVELGLDVDSWYTYDEVEWLLSATAERKDLLDVARALSGTSRTVTRPAHPVEPGAGRSR